MRIVYVLDDDTCLLGLYTGIETAALLRQTCKPFATNAILLARRPHLQLRAHTGEPRVRSLGGVGSYAFPTAVDDDGTWKLQQKTLFKLSVAIVADLAFVGEDAHGSITFTSRERVCTHTLATPTRSIEVRAHLVTGDGVAAPEPAAERSDGGSLLIFHESPKKNAAEVPPEALPIRCSVTTLSSKVVVLDRMKHALEQEEESLVLHARYARHALSTACAARIATLKEAIKIDQACVGKRGWQGKPCAHFRLRLSMAIFQQQGASTTRVVLGTTVDTHPFFVAARVETPEMKSARKRRGEKLKEDRAARNEDTLEEWAAEGLQNAEFGRRNLLGAWCGNEHRGVAAVAEEAVAEEAVAEEAVAEEAVAEEAVAEEAVAEEAVAEEAVAEEAVAEEDHRTESEKRADAADKRRLATRARG